MNNEQQPNPDLNPNQDNAEETFEEMKTNFRESGRKAEHEASHLKDTKNPRGHQFGPSRRTTNKE